MSQDLSKKRDMRNVEFLPLPERLTVREAVGRTAIRNEKFPLDKVIIIGEDPDGELYICNSSMKRSEANWLLDIAKNWVVSSE